VITAMSSRSSYSTTEARSSLTRQPTLSHQEPMRPADRSEVLLRSGR
jgi:hypothetical protein